MNKTIFISDFFIEEADEWREDAWLMIKRRSDLHFYMVTKRPERIAQCLPEDWGERQRVGGGTSGMGTFTMKDWDDIIHELQQFSGGLTTSNSYNSLAHAELTEYRPQRFIGRYLTAGYLTQMMQARPEVLAQQVAA